MNVEKEIELMNDAYKKIGMVLKSTLDLESSFRSAFDLESFFNEKSYEDEKELKLMESIYEGISVVRTYLLLIDHHLKKILESKQKQKEKEEKNE